MATAVDPFWPLQALRVHVARPMRTLAFFTRVFIGQPPLILVEALEGRT